jgi:adenylate cyclase
MRLGTLLALMFSVLLAFTAALIGWRGYSNSRGEIRHFTQQEFAETNGFATHHVLDFLNDPADRLLSEYTLRARRGMLPLRDPRALGFDLAERLRVNPPLAWISYSDAATGQFTGVWRTRQDEIVLNLSTPGSGHLTEMLIRPDGSTVPYDRPEPPNYDPRTRDWYKHAEASDTTVWSPPYTFFEGTRGITASRAWRTSDGAAVSGVFTVDFFLADLQRLLDSIVGDVDSMFCAILEPDGTLLCTSQNPDGPELAGALSDWVKANPQFKDNGQANPHLVPLRVGSTDYLAAFAHVDAPSGLKCIVATIQPRALVYRGLDKAGRQMIEIATAALAVAVVLGVLLAYRICAPLHTLERDLARVGQLHLAEGTRPRSVVREVNQLHDAASRMKTGLRSFLKYVPGDLVRQVLASGREAVLGVEIRRLTVFFSDIEGFTAHTEATPPDQLVHQLADYLEQVSSQLRGHDGEIDKFIGDGVLAFFNAPGHVPQHERLACRAALAAQQGLEAWQRQHHSPAFRTRVGLHTGDILVGNMGTADRLTYTVLGDGVNVASRLENLNKIYGTRILASGEVREHAGPEFEWRHLDRASLAGRKGATEIYELLGLQGEVDAGRLRRRDLYEKALDLYIARSFAAAEALFAQLAAASPEDKAAALMATRCQQLAADPPPADWDGVFTHTSKG